MLGLVNIDYRNRKAELYIAIGDREYRGKNLGSKALQIALKYAFEELVKSKIVCKLPRLQYSTLISQ